MKHFVQHFVERSNVGTFSRLSNIVAANHVEVSSPQCGNRKDFKVTVIVEETPEQPRIANER